MLGGVVSSDGTERPGRLEFFLYNPSREEERYIECYNNITHKV